MESDAPSTVTLSHPDASLDGADAALPFRLGAYELRERIGRGGWGGIYGGIHVGADGVEVPVAVKVLTGKRGRTELARQALEREIEAVAALDHPHVVRIHDHGRVSIPEGALSGLPTDSPYFAMERLDGGTLKSRLGTLTWGAQRRILLALLDALAHAHARGLIHRDVKPSNVLLGLDGSVKLADFGLAEGVDPLGDAGRPIAGTPGYMPPEQIRGRHRQIGPWTDLYALGCVAYELACRTSLFTRGRTSGETLLEHLSGQPWPVEAREPVPPGLQGWIEQMTDRDPRFRFQRAADAAHALRALGEPRAPSPQKPPGARPTHEDSTTILPPATEAPAASSRDAAPPPTPLATTWKDLRPPVTRPPNAGIGLYGLRPVPMVGRQPERDALWAALHAVVAGQRPRVVLLHGVAGVGRSALLRWLLERVDELGAATTLTASWSPDAGPVDGLTELLSRHLLAGTLEPEALRAALAEDLATEPGGNEEADDLVRVLRPKPRRWLPLGQVLALTRRALERAARERPVVVGLDDLQWGRDGVAFVDHLLAVSPPAPILVVATVEDDGPATSQAAALAALEGRDAVTRLSIGPLPRPDHRELVESLLGFSGPLVTRLVDRTEGSPAFAVQLVADYVQRGLLEPGARGLRLTADAALPDDLAASWRGRVDRLLAGLPSGAEGALELAATLGLEIDDAEWVALTEAETREPLRRALFKQGLAQPRPGGWRFVHGLCREAVVARASDRATSLHARCADLLAATEGASPLRLARHLRAAGRDSEAIEPLLAATRAYRERKDHSRRGEITDDLEAALIAAGRPPTDPAWHRLWTVRMRLHLLAHDPEAAEREVERMEALAATHPSDAVSARAIANRGCWLMRTGRLTDAAELLQGLVPLAEQAGDAEVLDTVYAVYGFALNRMGRPDEARSICTRRMAALQQWDRPAEVAHCLAAMVRVEINAGDLEAAEAAGLRGVAHAQAHGFRTIEAKLANELGEIHRLRGEWELAERCYRRNVEIYTAQGYQGLMVADWNIGLVLLQAGRPAEARPRLAAADRRIRASGGRHLLAASTIELAACDAAEGRRDDCASRLQQVPTLLAETGYMDVDIADFAELLAHHAEPRGWTELAAESLGIAADAWAQLGRDDKQAAARARQAALVGRG